MSTPEKITYFMKTKTPNLWKCEGCSSLMFLAGFEPEGVYGRDVIVDYIKANPNEKIRFYARTSY